MASVVRLGDATAALGFVERVQNAVQHSQSCKLQCKISSWRPVQRIVRAVLSPNPLVSHGHRNGNALLKSTRSYFQFKAMALPLDRKNVEDNNGSESEVAAEEPEEPWLGAVIFKRSGHKSHYEFHTSLERLGLGKLSTESSRALANSMGLNAAASSASATEDFSTPVSISIDVSREEDSRDLRLDGIARTTFSLCCNRCLSPVVERVFASFNLLLTENPVLEPTQQRIGVVLGDNGPEDDGAELDLDLDDKLHFPREVKEIDLSKYLRDSVHLEIPYKSLCSARCAGLCLTCGVNLNERTCNCTEVTVKPTWGPLEQLRRQLKDDERLQE